MTPITLQVLTIFISLITGILVTALLLNSKNNKEQEQLKEELISNRATLKQLETDRNNLQEKNSGLTKQNLDINSQQVNDAKELALSRQELSQLLPLKTEITEARATITSLSNKQSEQEEKLKQLAERKNQLSQKDSELKNYNKQLVEQAKKISQQAEQLSQLDETRDKLKTNEKKLESMATEIKEQTGQNAELTEKLKQFNNLGLELTKIKDNFTESQRIASDRQAEIAELATLLKKEKSASTEKLELLNQAREEMANRFKTVAQEIFEEKGKKFNQDQEDKLGTILNPFKEQLTTFHNRVNEIHHNNSKDQASLRQELETLRQSNLILNQEAKNLSQALKGDKKIQGNWGEMILEKVLEQSGLRKGIEYETQAGHRDDDNKLLKPDVIVHLPEGRDIIIDSKVSLVAYEESCAVEDEQQKKKALSRHILSVRNHINGLSAKDYGNLPGLKSPDFVLMFMPIEPAFMAAFQADDGLFNYAFDRKIVVVTPTTLLATLRTIENIWRFERQNQNTKAIASLASKVYDKLRLYLEDMDKLGKQLETAQGTYNNAIKRLSQGHGNLVSQAEKFVELGVKIKKELPASITAMSNNIDSGPSDNSLNEEIIPK